MVPKAMVAHCLGLVGCAVASHLALAVMEAHQFGGMPCQSFFY